MTGLCGPTGLEQFDFVLTPISDFGEDSIYVYINPKKHWARYESLCDEYSEEEKAILEPFLNRYALYEEGSGVFEYSGGLSVEQLQQSFEKEGLEYGHELENYFEFIESTHGLKS